jgi:hypothetical protein
MPALIHNSSALTSSGIALMSQSLEEQPSGLVRVTVSYAVTQAKSADLASLFYLDAPPPVFPTVVRRDDLQRGSLFLEKHNVVKSFGQWVVQASYVGAKLLRSGFGGLLNRNDEARVTPPVRFLAGLTFGSDSIPQLIPAYDVLSVKFLAQTVTRSIAGAYGSSFDLETIGTDASGFIFRAEYGVISRAATIRRTRLNYPSPAFILKQFEPVLNTSTKIDNITNAVTIATTVQVVVFDKPQGPDFL